MLVFWGVGRSASNGDDDGDGLVTETDATRVLGIGQKVSKRYPSPLISPATKTSSLITQAT
jgi:hypothetical protein